MYYADILSQKICFVLVIWIVNLSFACNVRKPWAYSGLSKPYGHDFLEESLIHTVSITAVYETQKQHCVSEFLVSNLGLE